MAQLQYPNGGAIMLAATIRTYLALSKAKLIKSDFTPRPTTVIGDLIEADFAGYAAKTITTWGVPYYDPDGGATIQSPLEQWDCTGGGPSNNIYGVWVEDAAGNLLVVVKFDAPVSMSVVNQSVPLNIALNFGR